MVDYVEFIKAVQSMRTLQQRFFASRSRAVLERCKVAEAKVDKWLEVYRVQQMQLSMWRGALATDDQQAGYEVEPGENDET